MLTIRLEFNFKKGLIFILLNLNDQEDTTTIPPQM
jgi:hypothetical protein